MNVRLKIRGSLLDEIRLDLRRRHPFAAERVGFCTAGAAGLGDGILLIVRGYMPVADEDYEPDLRAGARIGSAAMRKAVQAAYRPPATLLHIHTHGGRGKPSFSRLDLKSAPTFVPGFFEAVPRMPHGLLVLSNNDAHGMLWLGSEKAPVTINAFERIDAPLQPKWGSHELA